MPEQPIWPTSPRWLVAVDLEATLVSNAVSQFPRPGLRAFFDGLRELDVDLAYFTAVDEVVLRDVLQTLADEGDIPAWAAELPAIAWEGRHKDLTLTGRGTERVLLVDDMPTALPPDQVAQWVPVSPYEPPFDPEDSALAEALVLIRKRIRETY